MENSQGKLLKDKYKKYLHNNLLHIQLKQKRNSVKGDLNTFELEILFKSIWHMAYQITDKYDISLVFNIHKLSFNIMKCLWYEERSSQSPTTCTTPSQVLDKLNLTRPPRAKKTKGRIKFYLPSDASAYVAADGFR